jgi:hypothetical protein
MRAETLKGHLDGLLLASLETGPRHGYAIMETTPAGRRTLTAERGTWREFAAAVTALLEPAPRPVTP